MSNKKATRPKVTPSAKKVRKVKVIPNYEAQAREHMERQVEFQILAKGLKNRMVGVLVGYVPAGKLLTDPTVPRAADLKLLEGFSTNKVRPRAAVCIVRTHDSDSGQVRFFTPRPQQMVW